MDQIGLLLAYRSMLIANAFRDGVTRREIPYARYACR